MYTSSPEPEAEAEPADDPGSGRTRFGLLARGVSLSSRPSVPVPVCVSVCVPRCLCRVLCLSFLLCVVCVVPCLVSCDVDLSGPDVGSLPWPGGVTAAAAPAPAPHPPPPPSLVPQPDQKFGVGCASLTLWGANFLSTDFPNQVAPPTPTPTPTPTPVRDNTHKQPFTQAPTENLSANISHNTGQAQSAQAEARPEPSSGVASSTPTPTPVSGSLPGSVSLVPPPIVSVSLRVVGGGVNVTLDASIVAGSIGCFGTSLCWMTVDMQPLYTQYQGLELQACVTRTGSSSGFVLIGVIVGGVSLLSTPSQVLLSGSQSVVLSGSNFAVGSAMLSNQITFEVQNTTLPMLVAGQPTTANDTRLFVSFSCPWSPLSCFGPVWDPSPLGVLRARVSTYGVTTPWVQVATIEPALVDNTSILTCQQQGADGSVHVLWGVNLLCVLWIRGNGVSMPGTLDDFTKPHVIRIPKQSKTNTQAKITHQTHNHHHTGTGSPSSSPSLGELLLDDCTSWGDGSDGSEAELGSGSGSGSPLFESSVGSFRSSSNSSARLMSCGSIANVSLSPGGMSITFWYIAGSGPGSDQEQIVVKTRRPGSPGTGRPAGDVSGSPVLVFLVDPSAARTSSFWSLHNQVLIILAIGLACVIIATLLVCANEHWACTCTWKRRTGNETHTDQHQDTTTSITQGNDNAPTLEQQQTRQSHEHEAWAGAASGFSADARAGADEDLNGDGDGGSGSGSHSGLLNSSRLPDSTVSVSVPVPVPLSVPILIHPHTVYMHVQAGIHGASTGTETAYSATEWAQVQAQAQAQAQALAQGRTHARAHAHARTRTEIRTRARSRSTSSLSRSAEHVHQLTQPLLAGDRFGQDPPDAGSGSGSGSGTTSGPAPPPPASRQLQLHLQQAHWAPHEPA